MKNRHLLGVLAIATSLFATTGCVATASDGYYDNGGYGYGYSRPADVVYVEGNRYDDRGYRDRERDRQAREREARERQRDRDRDRQARERDRDRDQRARDEDRRRELERQARDRDRDRFGGSRHEAECAAQRRQIAGGGDTVVTTSRPCR